MRLYKCVVLFRKQMLRDLVMRLDRLLGSEAIEDGAFMRTVEATANGNSTRFIQETQLPFETMQDLKRHLIEILHDSRTGGFLFEIDVSTALLGPRLASSDGTASVAVEIMSEINSRFQNIAKSDDDRLNKYYYMHGQDLYTAIIFLRRPYTISISVEKRWYEPAEARLLGLFMRITHDAFSTPEDRLRRLDGILKHGGVFEFKGIRRVLTIIQFFLNYYGRIEIDQSGYSVLMHCENTFRGPGVLFEFPSRHIPDPSLDSQPAEFAELRNKQIQGHVDFNGTWNRMGRQYNIDHGTVSLTYQPTYLLIPSEVHIRICKYAFTTFYGKNEYYQISVAPVLTPSGPALPPDNRPQTRGPAENR